ncbi:MAG: GspH/FimT family protein [Tissierellaceae bacterium]|nr:GspH/FimT family protein [Tissierellaceae bacterium]
MTAKKGYTLIEILIGIALFSILFSIAMPNTNYFKDMMEKQEIVEFKKDLLYARNMAIVENRTYFVYFFKDQNSYSLKLSETSPPIKSKTFGSGLKLNNNAVGSFIFKPSGTSGNSNTIYINTRRNERYVVTIAPAANKINIVLEEVGGKFEK